ncbi:hypothetical protein ABPG72_012488 [Tetrahymena utriculariae]
MRIITIKKNVNLPLQIKKQIKKQFQQTIFREDSIQPPYQKLQKNNLSLVLNEQSSDFVIQSKDLKQNEILSDKFEQFKILNHMLLEYCLVEQYVDEKRIFLQKDILCEYTSTIECLNEVTENEFLENSLIGFFESLNQVDQIVQSRFDEIQDLCRRGHKNTLKIVYQMLIILSSVNSFLAKKLKHANSSLYLKAKFTLEFIIQSSLRRISLMLDDFVYFKELQQVLLMEKKNEYLIKEYYQYYEQKLLESKQVKILPCIIQKSITKDFSNYALSEQYEKLYQQNQNFQSKNLQVNKYNNMKIKFSGNQQNAFQLTDNQENYAQNLDILQHSSALCLQIQQLDHENQKEFQMKTPDGQSDKLKQSQDTIINSSTIPKIFNQIEGCEPQIFTKNQNLQLQSDFDKLQQQQKEKFNEATIAQNQQDQNYCKKLLTLQSTSQQNYLSFGDKSYQFEPIQPSKLRAIVKYQVKHNNSLSDKEKVGCQEKDHLINVDISKQSKSAFIKKSSLKANQNIKKDENTSNQIQTAQKENDYLIFLENQSQVEEEIQNISFEEKLYKQNEEYNNKVLLEFQHHQIEKKLQKQQKIITQFKKFRQLKKIEEKNFQEDQEEEDISEIYEEILDSYFKVGDVLFQMQTQFVGEIHTVSINELVFLNSCNHMSISCDMKAYITKLNNFFLLDEFINAKGTSQQIDQKEISLHNLIEKIDFGRESISQVSFITSKSLLIFLSNDNQLLICKYSEQEQLITLEQIIKNQYHLPFGCWSYLTTLDTIVTDGHYKLQFWQYKLNDKDFQQNVDDAYDLVLDDPVYTIDHTLSDTTLCFYEEKSILFQAGFRTIISYLVKINDENNKITHQILQTLNCQKLGHINSIQIIKRNQFSHFLLSLHCKNKIILWNIHHLTQQYIYSISLSDQINQIIFNPKINLFFILIDGNLSTEIAILDQNLQNVNFPKNHKQLKTQNCKITKLSQSPEMSRLSIGYENGFLQFVEIIRPYN